MLEHVMTAVLTFVVTVFFAAILDVDVKRNYVKAGVIVVDNKPYRITPLSP